MVRAGGGGFRGAKIAFACHLCDIGQTCPLRSGQPAGSRYRLTPQIAMRRLAASFVPFVILAACTAQSDKPAANATGGAVNTEPVPAEALTVVDTATVMQHVRVLAHDSLMGRQPGSPG